jgi:RNA polymerase sigma-70 factor (ECF subfamily)
VGARACKEKGESLPKNESGRYCRDMPATWPDESDAVARIRAGDEAAFESLFREYHAPLCRFVYGFLRSRDLAEEVVQEVFLALWSRRASWDVQGTVRSYLYGAARNRALNHLKRARIEQKWREAAPSEALAPAEATDSAETKEVAALVRSAIDALPERCRLVMMLRWQHHLKHVEIAEALGISIKGVENQLRRGLDLLRRALPHLRD